MCKLCVWVYGCMGPWRDNLRRQLAAPWMPERDVYMGVCVYVFMCIWVQGCMGAWVYGRMGVWVYGYMGVWLYGAWVYGCMDAWVYDLNPDPDLDPNPDTDPNTPISCTSHLQKQTPGLHTHTHNGII